MARLRLLGRALGIGLLAASFASAEAGLLSSQYGGLSESIGQQGSKIRDRQKEFALQRQMAQAQRRSIFRILSWNVQTFGKLKPEREAAYEMLGEMFSSKRSSKVLALQEVANDKGSDTFSDLLPGGGKRWNKSFQNTSDSQDNGFYTQKSVEVECDEFLFARENEDGGYDRDDKAQHPVRAAHMRVGDFDFTLITLHLTFKGGDTNASGEELKDILRWLENYFDNPENDPDVILAGDFNMTTRAGATSSRKVTLEDIIEQFPTFQRTYDADGKRVPKKTELIALVDAPTSRHKGETKNNYDHFIVSGDVYDEEYVGGSAGPIPAAFIEAAEKAHDVYVSDHLPISAGFLSKGTGNDGETIRSDQLGPTSSRSCWKRGRK